VFRYTSAGSFRIALLALTRNEAKRDPHGMPRPDELNADGFRS